MSAWPVFWEPGFGVGVAERSDNGLRVQDSRTGPYVIAAGLEESVPGTVETLRGRFVNLFDPELKVRREVAITPGSRWFLRNLDRSLAGGPVLVASACKALALEKTPTLGRWMVEGVADTPGVVLLSLPEEPRRVTLDGKAWTDWRWDAGERLAWIRLSNTSAPRELAIGL